MQACSGPIGGRVGKAKQLHSMRAGCGWLAYNQSLPFADLLADSSMKTPLAPMCALFASLSLFVSLAGSQTPDAPRAWIDPTGPDWRSRPLADFDNANGDKDTWTGSGNDIHSTGLPVGVARSKKQYTNFELVAEWRHLKSAGNSGIFVWAPEEAFKDLKPGKLPRGGIEVQILDHGFAEQYEKRAKK